MTQSLKEITSDRSINIKYSHVFEYSSWNEFIRYSPWIHWNNMELCNYIWTSENILYILFDCLKDINDKRHFIIKVTPDDDTPVREWLKLKISNIWKI
jgi:hypothetical protein